jgi:hypothetical protein
MPKKSSKKQAKSRMSRLDKKLWKIGIWVTVIVAIVIFAVFMLMLRNTISEISKDPSLTSLNNTASFNVVTLMNRNKNTFADRVNECWNQKHPFAACNEENKIIEGKYALRGSKDMYWLEGPFNEGIKHSLFEIPEYNIREILGGFMLSEKTYYQIIHISYPKDENHMQIEVETVNDNGGVAKQTINLKK